MRPKKLWTLVTTLAVFLVTVLLGRAAWSSVTTQSSMPTQQRKLSRLVLPQEPIEMQEIKFKSGEIVTFSDKDSKTQKRHAEVFTADEDWLAGLEGKFKNTYTKTITLIQIGLSVPSPDNPKHDIGQVFPFVRSKIQLVPGQEITLKFSDNGYGALRDMLKRNGHATLVEAVLAIDMVVFDDGTAWRLGKFFRQDPNNTNRWILIGIKEFLQGKGISLRQTSYKSSAAQKVVFAKEDIFAVFEKTTYKSNVAYDCAFIVGFESHLCGDYGPGVLCYVTDDWLYYHYDGDVYTDYSQQQCQYNGDCCFGPDCFPQVLRGASQVNAGAAERIKMPACLLAEGRNISLNSQAPTRRPIPCRWER